MAHARFILGDPATDGLDFLLGDHLPEWWRGAAWRMLTFAAILLATLAGVVAMDRVVMTFPMVAEGAAL